MAEPCRDGNVARHFSTTTATASNQQEQEQAVAVDQQHHLEVDTLEYEKRALLKRIDDLKHELECTNKKIESLSKEVCELRENESVHKAKQESLEQQVRKLNEDKLVTEAEYESLKDTIKDHEEEICKLKKQLKEKNNDIKALQNKVEELSRNREDSQNDHDCQLLYVSQTACRFEQAICSHVLPEVFEGDRHATLQALMDYLNNPSTKLPDLDEASADEVTIISDAKKRWEKVCTKLQLPHDWNTMAGSWNILDSTTPKFIKAIGFLKNYRNYAAHPNKVKVSLAKEKVATDSFKEGIASWKYKLIKDLIFSMPEYITKCGLESHCRDFNI